MMIDEHYVILNNSTIHKFKKCQWTLPILFKDRHTYVLVISSIIISVKKRNFYHLLLLFILMITNKLITNIIHIYFCLFVFFVFFPSFLLLQRDLLIYLSKKKQTQSYDKFTPVIYVFLCLSLFFSCYFFSFDVCCYVLLVKRRKKNTYI